MNLTCLMKKSQLHGINRLSEKKDRFIWLIALCLLFGSAIVSVLITLSRYEENPTFLTYKDSGLYETNFPTVMICPELEFPIFKMEQFLDEVKIPPPLNRTYLMRVLRQLATYYSPDVYYTLEDLEHLELLLDHNEIAIDQAFLRLTSTCEEILIRCRWRGVITDCTKLFQMMTMQFGVCCVFNGRSLIKDILTEGFPLKTPTTSVKTKSIGYKSGLDVAVDQGTYKNLRNLDLNYKWAILATPQRYVESLAENGSALSPGIEIWFGYKTQTLEITENSKSLSLGLRRCELNSTPLKYFPLYKRQYCRMECEVANVVKRCNCALPTHPVPQGWFCKAKDVTCAKNVVRQSYVENCGCLPTCDSLTNENVITTYNLSTKHIPIDHFYNDLNLNEVTIVRVFVYQRTNTKKTRQSFFTAHDLFAQLGGIFNVFFGCSILSLFELSQLIMYGIRKWRLVKISTTNSKVIHKKVNLKS